MKVAFVAGLAAVISTTATAQEAPTAGQIEMRGRLLNVSLADQCQQKFGEQTLLKDALMAFKQGVARTHPSEADAITDRVQAKLSSDANRKTEPSSIVTKALCDRVRLAVDNDLKG